MLGSKESSSFNVLKRDFDANVEIIILFGIWSVEKIYFSICGMFFLKRVMGEMALCLKHLA